jgi:copper(I)-binding protein
MKMSSSEVGAWLAAWLMVATSTVWADVEVSGAWARATMPGQKVAGVYMQLRSDTPAKLVGAKTDVADAAEVHEMRNDGGVMRMRRIDALDLPAGKTVVLAPGGYHVMLQNIHRPLKARDRVSLTLLIEEKGKRVEIPVNAEVRSLMEEGSHN